MGQTINLEIRDAEGGTDAKLLVSEMVDIYTKAARLNNLECNLVEERNGFAHLCL
jgi:protein subunit release factor A